jgi:hypothetical protein
MTLRRLAYVIALLVAFGPASASAAHYDTANFSVSAPNADLAKRFGDMAEHYRREKAVEWLGKEMPQWSRRCPLRVEVTQDARSRVTSSNS